VSYYDSFAEVIREVARHVDATGHQDIRAWDDPPALLTGYCCLDCPPQPTQSWMAHVDTIYQLPEALQRQVLDTKRRIKFGRAIVKKALEPKPYRPTSWERVLRA